MGSDDIITSDGSNVEDPACVGGADLSVNQVRVESSDDSTSTVIWGDTSRRTERTGCIILVYQHICLYNIYIYWYVYVNELNGISVFVTHLVTINTYFFSIYISGRLMGGGESQPRTVRSALSSVSSTVSTLELY